VLRHGFGAARELTITPGGVLPRSGSRPFSTRASSTGHLPLEAALTASGFGAVRQQDYAAARQS
jgi:hypothetical protein